MMHFKTDEEAIEWGRTKNKSKYEYTNCKIGDDDVILCQTNLVYEDEIWGKMFESIKYLISLLPYDTYDDSGIDEASELRDFAIELFEKNYNIRIVHAYDEY